MILSTTSQTIEAFTNATATTTEPTFSTTYGDITTLTFVPGGSDGSLNGTTAVTVVSAPAASTERHVKELHFYNADTVTHTFTVRLKDGVSNFIYLSVPVVAGNFLRYSQENGWVSGIAPAAGTVTSVAMSVPTFLSVSGSPITTSGTFAVTLATESANTVFAGPTSGASATPTFRAIVAADLPGGFNGFANPTASVALTAVNGVAVTAMRSDGAPALDQSISPTWSGTHIFSNPINASLGSSSLPSYTFSSHTGYGFFWDNTNTGIGIAVNGVQTGEFLPGGLTLSIPGGGSANLQIQGEAGVINSVQRFSNDAGAPAYQGVKFRGTIASPANITLGDALLNFIFRGFVGANKTGATITGILTETGTPSTTAFGTDIVISTIAIGSGTLTEALRINNGFGIKLLGTTVLDQNRNFVGASVASAFQRVVPTTGFSQTINDNVGALILKPAGTLATGTITMPANPLNGQEVSIMSNQQITALTVNANSGQTISGTFSATIFTANAFATWKYVTTDTNWYRAG